MTEEQHRRQAGGTEAPWVHHPGARRRIILVSLERFVSGSKSSIFQEKMIKRTLKGIAVVLALIVMTLLVLYLNRSDPYSIIPGKQLRGAEVTGPIDAWSFVLHVRTVTNEVRPSAPYSFDTGHVSHVCVFDVPSATATQLRLRHCLLQDPNMRSRVGGKLYRVRGTRVEDPELVSELHRARGQRNPDQEERTPEEMARLARVWFFRIDSR